MSHWEQVRVVAAWEFRRYFKMKDQLLGLFIFVAMGALSYGVGRLATGGRGAMTVAVAPGIELAEPAEGRLRFVPAPTDSAERERMLVEGDVGGVLTRRLDGGFDLRVEKDPRFLARLQPVLAELVRRERLAASGVSEAELMRILAPAKLDVTFTDPDRQRVGKAERIVAAVFVGLVMLGIFTSMAYLLTGITGEKQLRVTESITAIIPPQAWIDGKILGISLYTLATLANMAAGGVLLALVAKTTWNFTIPPIIVRPEVILVLLVFSALALAMWNAAFAAFASTIDDPNTSARTSIMFLPMLPIAMTVSVLRDPESFASRVLSQFPLTSPSAMPARVILSNPGLLEIASAVALLIATIWLFRRLAGRIFEVGMLMYGKEPSFAEMWRWTKAKSW